MNNQAQAEKLAQAALRGWFHDPTGFRDMISSANRPATVAVLRVLDVPQKPERGVLVNQECSLSAAIFSTRLRVLALEKQARKTPPKTLEHGALEGLASQGGLGEGSG
jgi:hypothetical protein